ncbi:MAG: zinc-ribbon domain-containing protein [Promethearchaeota archaeon]
MWDIEYRRRRALTASEVAFFLGFGMILLAFANLFANSDNIFSFPIQIRYDFGVLGGLFMWGVALYNFVRYKTIIAICSNCGTTIERNAQFCQSCGAKFEQKKAAED